MGIHEGHRQRLLRRFLEEGLEHFEPHNKLELLLFYAIPRRDTNEIAHRLLKTFGSFSAVLDAPLEELQKVTLLEKLMHSVDKWQKSLTIQ